MFKGALEAISDLSDGVLQKAFTRGALGLIRKSVLTRITTRLPLSPPLSLFLSLALSPLPLSLPRSHADLFASYLSCPFQTNSFSLPHLSNRSLVTDLFPCQKTHHWRILFFCLGRISKIVTESLDPGRPWHRLRREVADIEWELSTEQYLCLTADIVWELSTEQCLCLMEDTE